MAIFGYLSLALKRKILKSRKNEMGEAYNPYGEVEGFIHGFGKETCGKGTTWKIQMWMGG